MDVWTVEQKHEVWYQTSVHADSIEEAIKAADSIDMSEWTIQPMTAEFCDEYWAMNEETTDQYSVIDGRVTKE